jgi:hypothetical protein
MSRNFFNYTHATLHTFYTHPANVTMPKLSRHSAKKDDAIAATNDHKSE